ncbi:MAG: hypothetical protein Q8O31_01680, partial [Rhodocyclaceae bacterium]|nr:hypothetical protein [Rhodocyclaceae bacterium]
ISEATLLSDYAQAIGGKMRINVNLGILSRLGFIERRNKIITEGPLLDLAFDYEQLAPRIINGALGELLAGKTAATESLPPLPFNNTAAPPSTDSLVKAAADALNLEH